MGYGSDFDKRSRKGLNELISNFEIWTTLEEKKLLEKLKTPVKLKHLSEQEQFKIQAMIRKSLVTKIGHNDPSVVANDQTT
jgi:hypothetical protein